MKSYPQKPEKILKTCLFDGSHYDEHGIPIECRCDECDYLAFCAEETLIWLNTQK